MAESHKTPEPQTAAAQAPAADVAALADEALAGAQSSLEQMQQSIDTQAMDLPALDAPALSAAVVNSIELLGDVELNVTVELGRTQMLVEDVLRLGDGSVVELDKLAGDPVDVYVNGRLIARGEVLVLNDNFCIRISEIVSDLEEQIEQAAQQQMAQHAGT